MSNGEAGPRPQTWRRHVLIVSDATGDTCDMVVRAALSQFQGTEVILDRYPHVRTMAQISEILQRARELNGVVVYTMVSVELRQRMLAAGLEVGVTTLDILGPILTRLSHHLELSPLATPGLFRHLDQAYFKRLEAVDFTVAHDDGMGAETLHEAEIVIVGVSRTSKTPVSLYLSFRGWKVANIPIVSGLELPPQLFTIDPQHIIGFTIDPPALRALRLVREKRMRSGMLGAYVDEDEIRREIEAAAQLFRARGWPVLNVTMKAIEETSTEVMQTIFTRTGQKKGSIDTDA
jgi:[pyruvate, water dikinase]-phosphate phosphotransferase / [pyruvate, water dikinase] kinase